jgi:uncharacterized membrane protein
MDDLGGTEQPKHGIPVGRMGDITGEEPHGWWQVDRSTCTVYLRVQDVHHSDVVTGFDEPARKGAPNKSCPTGDEHGC